MHFILIFTPIIVLFVNNFKLHIFHCKLYENLYLYLSNLMAFSKYSCLYLNRCLFELLKYFQQSVYLYFWKLCSTNLLKCMSVGFVRFINNNVLSRDKYNRFKAYIRKTEAMYLFAIKFYHTINIRVFTK